MNIHEGKGISQTIKLPNKHTYSYKCTVIRYVLVNNFSVIFLSCSEGSFWVEPVLSSR